MKLDKSHFLIGAGCLIIGFWLGTTLDYSRGIPFVGKTRQKAIALYVGNTPLKVGPSPKTPNPILTADDVTDVRAEYVTDPFVVKEEGTWFMFFGVRRADTHMGVIGLATSTDGYDWRYQGIVLSEPFHTSYPYVFKWQDEYFMVPESPDADSIRLYKADGFPNKWTLEKILLTGNFVDPTLFRFKDRWWMFAESNPKGHDRLSLFYADELTGPWIEHPKSPVIDGNGHIARPGGRVMNLGDRLIRFTQDDEPYYGNQLWAFEITHLSPSEYKEQRVGDLPILREGNMAWNNKGMHHIDPHQLKPNEWIAFVSGHGESLAFGLQY